MASCRFPLLSYAPVAAPLLDRPQRLAGHPSKGLNFSFQGECLGCEFPVLQGVLVSARSPATSAVHPADARSPHRRRTAL
jgi:hypothetical protein